MARLSQLHRFLQMWESRRVCALPDTKLHAYSEVFQTLGAEADAEVAEVWA